MRFRDLLIGDTFDWIDDANRMHNSFFARCVKTSPRKYEACADRSLHYTVGSINAKVFHVAARTGSKAPA